MPNSSLYEYMVILVNYFMAIKFEEVIFLIRIILFITCIFIKSYTFYKIQFCWSLCCSKKLLNKIKLHLNVNNIKYNQTSFRSIYHLITKFISPFINLLSHNCLIVMSSFICLLYDGSNFLYWDRQTIWGILKVKITIKTETLIMINYFLNCVLELKFKFSFIR